MRLHPTSRAHAPKNSHRQRITRGGKQEYSQRALTAVHRAECPLPLHSSTRRIQRNGPEVPPVQTQGPERGKGVWVQSFFGPILCLKPLKCSWRAHSFLLRFPRSFLHGFVRS